MRNARLLVRFSVASVVGLAVLGAVACGGNDKPPLTPDDHEPQPADLAAEAGAAPMGSRQTAPATTPPPAK